MLTLILGTQPDIYRAWFRRPPPAPPRIIDEWVSIEAADAEEAGEKTLRLDDDDGDAVRRNRKYDYEYAVGGGKGVERVVDISAKFKVAARLGEDDDLAADHDPDAKEVDIVPGGHGYRFEPRGES
jgi:hypothetical protein